MPPAKKICCSVIVFDVNSGDEFKTQAVKCYVELCARKIFTASDDLTKLILINAAETENDHPGKYKHIVEATGMVEYQLEHAKLIEDAVPSPGNWLEGLLVGVQELIKFSSKPGVYSLQLVMFSDLKTPLSTDKTEKLIYKITSTINEYFIYSLIFGPEVIINRMLKSKDDLLEWMQLLKFADGEKSANRDIAKRIVQSCLGIMCDPRIGVELFDFYKNSKGKNQWLVPLKMENLEIPCATSRCIDNKSVLKFVKVTQGFSSTICVDAEDESVEITSPTVSGIVMYEKLIFLPKYVEEGIKDYERFFKLFGFTDAANVPDHIMMSKSTNAVTTKKGDPYANVVQGLAVAAKKLNKYGIALKAHMRHCRPKLYCLIPRDDPSPHFWMVELPYAEQINVFYEETDVLSIKAKKDERGDDELKEVVYGFLDSIDMSSNVKLHPSLMGNVCNVLMMKVLAAKYLGQELDPNELPLLKDLCVTPDEDRLEKLLSSLQATE